MVKKQFKYLCQHELSSVSSRHTTTVDSCIQYFQGYCLRLSANVKPTLQLRGKYYSTL